ncbi:MAG: 4-hydroxy-tetrahydrodipicolinate reductase [Candidatus Dadabacteria bacterium]|nr:4-hydroxy-tetrahydrodipicolinate reductase [Candidatus Dadabacteria bacterium]MDE0519828.1 4-hydroxy-tetrahydrodipicolinate reductase [Candidatus Dadabacteria bacterium]MDE0663327.1 4-hydroxy-tetrahydrodipicolinate reductase [Candidatus Dadabacteria bacterium]
MIKVAVAGVCGRMGMSVASLAGSDGDIELVGATEAAGHVSVGRDLGDLVAGAGPGVSVSDSISEAARDSDVIIDFTVPEATLAHAEYSVRNGKSMVIGTTGFEPGQREELLGMLRRIPCVFSPNMSVGINVLFEISRQVASHLGESYDAEIFEAHHRGKADSPSGTAIALAEAVAAGLGSELEDVARYERHGRIGARGEGEIGIQTLRGGDVVGDHTVMFLGDGERVELTHRATSRENFSAGAIRAAKWIPGKPPGVYAMRDVLGF